MHTSSMKVLYLHHHNMCTAMTRKARSKSRHDELTNFREFSPLKVQRYTRGFQQNILVCIPTKLVVVSPVIPAARYVRTGERAAITQDQWHVIKRSWSVNKGTDWTSSSCKLQTSTCNFRCATIPCVEYRGQSLRGRHTNLLIPPCNSAYYSTCSPDCRFQ